MSHTQVIEEIQEYITKKQMGYAMEPVNLETLERWGKWLSEDWDEVHLPSYNQGYEEGFADGEKE